MHKKVELLEYEQCERLGSRKAFVVTISRHHSSAPSLRIPECRKGQWKRATLYLDEQTFNIYVKLGSEGGLKVSYYPKDNRIGFISMVGFFKEFDLDAPSFYGRYNAEFVAKDTLKIIYATKHSAGRVLEPKIKVTITISESEKNQWSRAAGEMPLSVFIRSAISRYIEDYQPEWGKSLELPAESTADPR